MTYDATAAATEGIEERLTKRVTELAQLMWCGKKCSLFALVGVIMIIIIMIIIITTINGHLPRQARDKHKERRRL